ncbi:30S ribosomal protein S4 [Alphaproteobacteria bacterium]|nr:30S ribosomal protein S4 [Alphaproteobacteria bacterium]
MAPKVEHKRHNSKHKIDRRMGVNLWGRTKSPLNARSYAPGQHGQRRKKPTDYGIQLMAKQKLKGYYGNIGEKQFKKYYIEAARRKGDTGENLIGILESRLDAVLYRSKLVPTVFAARQIINHGHVLLNGKRCNIGSVMLRNGDELQIKDKVKDMPAILEAMVSTEREVPEYVEANHDNRTAKFVRIPAFDEVPYPVMMEPNLVVEYYSR